MLAFVDEEGRFERIEAELDALATRGRQGDDHPLFGVALGVKDVFHVDGLPTRAGSRLPVEALAGPESTAVGLLRTAGAVVVGKTVTTELAYFAPGPTRNPHAPEHTPGGSSSGSAAAVAGGLCDLALGTQTIGSICRPAAFCGVVGFKPSYDRVSRCGVVPLAESYDHVGCFTRDVATAQRAAAVLCTAWRPGGIAALPARVGVPVGPYLERASDAGRSHFRAVCRRLADAGVEVVEVAAFADFETVYDRHQALTAFEAAAAHREWYELWGDRYHPKTAGLVERGRAVPPEEAASARAARFELRAELVRLMDAEGLDLWASPPATGPAPKGLDSTGDPVMNLPWTQAGLPALSLPAGADAGGLPMGLQLVGSWYADEALLAAAEALAPIVAATGADW